VQALEAQRKTETDSQAGPEAKRMAASLAESTRKRLALAGFTEEQLAVLEKGEKPSDHVTFYSPLAGIVLEKNVLLGDILEEGMTLYTVADLSEVWVQMQVAEADLSGIKAGMPVEVTAVPWAGVLFSGNVDLIYPELNAATRSVKVRVAVDNKEGRLKPGMFVTATVRTPAGKYGQIGTPSEPKVEGNEAIQAPSGAYPLDYCVVTGNKLGSMGEPVEIQYAGRTIKFCCNGCQAKFKADPEKYLKMIDEAATKLKQGGESSRWVEGYACPMHPDQLQAEPGPCRICGCGMQTVKWRVEKLLAIPETAVIDTGKRQVVYVESEPGVYDAREVVLGPRIGTFFPVTRGLVLGQRVVARGSFLIDAEARLNPAAAATFSGAAK
jgi:Cu(I)/Ag(I) efflux system membrane fusion protein